MSGSVAVLSDAFHTFSAVGGTLIALVALRLSQRPASREHTFGWGRAEIIGALFNGLSLIVMALYVFYMGAMRLMEPVELPTTVMLWVAAGGIATELVSFWLLYERQKDNLNLKGAFWHILQTFVGSAIIIISAVVIALTGFTPIDPLLGMAFGVLLFWASWSIIRSALAICCRARPRISTSMPRWLHCARSRACATSTTSTPGASLQAGTSSRATSASTTCAAMARASWGRRATA